MNPPVTKQIVPQVAANSPKSYDGPFGLAMGISTAELMAMKMMPSERSAGVYAGNPPKSVEGIDSVAALAAPKAGLCKILASAKVPTINGSGDQVKAEVDKIAETLATKYGANFEKLNFLGSGTYKRNPDMWMIGLMEESVIYAYEWSGAKANLPSGLQSIEVFASANGMSSGAAQVKYTFTNANQCAAEFKAGKAANL